MIDVVKTSSILKPLNISGKEDVIPIIEGGKGIGASDCYSAGAFAKAGAVGTFSGTSPFIIDENGERISIEYKEKTRLGRHRELINHTVEAVISHGKRARDISAGNGRIHINFLWEIGGIEEIIKASLPHLEGIVHGVTAGAGMPIRLGEIASKSSMYYYPIVSSMRAFRILWKKSYKDYSKFLGGVVYECPWRAGGHLGLLPKDDRTEFRSQIPEIRKIREFMNSIDLHHIPIVLAGGVWNLKEWEEYVYDPSIAPLAFQIGTRPLLTQESPIPIEWKRELINLKKDDIKINSFSPTGFPSSAIDNNFLKHMTARSKRQISFAREPLEELNHLIHLGPRKRKFYIKKEDESAVLQWIADGYSVPMSTPSNTFIFVTPEESQTILADQAGCMGCLANCNFSNWKDRGSYSTEKKADPRSFCIQKGLQNVVSGKDVRDQIMFSGSNGYKFSTDPMYARFRESLDKNDLPTIQELVTALMEGR